MVINFSKTYKDLIRIKTRLIEGIKQDLVLMARQRVPVDTRLLQKEGIKVFEQQTNSGITLTVFVPGVELEYPDRESIRADVLGLILDVGVRRGRDLKRTQAQPKNPAGSPTKGWFTKDFLNDVRRYLSIGDYRKHLG